MKAPTLSCGFAVALLASLGPFLRSQTLSPPSSFDSSLQNADAVGATPRDTILLFGADVAELRRRAENGDATAQNNLGYLYESDQILARDYRAAGQVVLSRGGAGLGGRPVQSRGSSISP